MNYIENIYICLAAPVLIAIFCAQGRGRRMLTFILAGLTACLLSSYISTFLASAYGMGYETASITITPLVEETMKLLPVCFYLLIFEPRRESIPSCVIATAIGFATFENVCYLIANGASDFMNLMIRGFGTGAMHVVCGVIIFLGMMALWDRLWLRTVGTVGLLAAAVTYHGIYNMLVLQSGATALIGYLIPLVSTLLHIVLRRNA